MEDKMDNSNPNVITNIITLIGTLGGILMGGVMTFLINKNLEQKKFQRDIYFSNKEKIDLAYKDIYDHLLKLKKYYYLLNLETNTKKVKIIKTLLH